MQTPTLPLSQARKPHNASAFQVNTNGAAKQPRWTASTQIATGQSTPDRHRFSGAIRSTNALFCGWAATFEARLRLGRLIVRSVAIFGRASVFARRLGPHP